MALSPCPQISALKSLLLQLLPGACLGCSAQDDLWDRQLVTAHVLLCLLRTWCLGGMCDTGPGNFWQQGGQHSTSFFPWKSCCNSHLILAHAICTWGKSSPVSEPNNPSFVNYSETETRLSHFEKLCQSLLAAACSGK